MDTGYGIEVVGIGTGDRDCGDRLWDTECKDMGCGG